MLLNFSEQGDTVEMGILKNNSTIYNYLVNVQNEYLTIFVKDNGVGIAKKNLLKLFEISEHYTTIGTKFEKGTGLGLILCKEFVEMHNGKIWAESIEGNGSTFYFTLPQKKGDD